MRYVPNGNYYARIKVHGKLIRRSVGTDTLSTAALRLLDFLIGIPAFKLPPYKLERPRLILFIVER